MAFLFEQDNSLTPVEGYDLIGDVHGCAATLERLLQKLGYKKQQGIYQHAKRRVIFLGDVIDRGPHIREAVLLAQSMVEKGSAHIILGNHEFNAITYCTKNGIDCTGRAEYLRPHTSGNTKQIAETLEQFANFNDDWRAILKWFRSLPLFMEFGDSLHKNAFRVVHACWDQPLIDAHKSMYKNGYFDEAFILDSVRKNSLANQIVQRLTRGVDLPLPAGVKVVSHDGYERGSFRTKFWAHSAQTYGELLFQPDPIPKDVANLLISKDHRAQMVHYASHEPPLFVGHYWLKGKPKPIANNVACLDYSAVKYGRLVAYRMDGEQQLQTKNFVWEYVDP